MSGKRTICPFKSSACMKEDCEHSIIVLSDSEYKEAMQESQRKGLPLPDKYACIWKELGKTFLLASQSAKEELTKQFLARLKKKKKSKED